MMKSIDICDDAVYVLDSLYECKRKYFCRHKVDFGDTAYCRIELLRDYHINRDERGNIDNGISN